MIAALVLAISVLLSALAVHDPGDITGHATYYYAGGNIGAAGPKLRHALGPHWRGTKVVVCAVAFDQGCVLVRLTDWCKCPRNLIDLSAQAFGVIAPLDRGRIRVVIDVWDLPRHHRIPSPPPTDT